MDFYFCLPLYGQFPTTTGLFTCSFLQSLLPILMQISCSYNMSYVITFDIWEVRIISYSYSCLSSRTVSYYKHKVSLNIKIYKSGNFKMTHRATANIGGHFYTHGARCSAYFVFRASTLALQLVFVFRTDGKRTDTMCEK